MTAVLGVNGHPGAQHDAAAAVLVDGQLVAAVEEERLCRRKHAYGLQATMAVREVLAVARLSLPEIDTVACPWLPSLMGLEPKDVEDDLRSWLSAVTGTPLSRTPAVRFVEHHAAHVWSGLAFWPCRHAASSAAVLVVDGAGESTAGAAYTFDGRQLTRLWSIAEEASLGIYYEALSRYLGFSWGEEGKTMGLAAYGRVGRAVSPPLVDCRFFTGPPASGLHGSAARARYRTLKEACLARLRSANGSGLTFNQRADLALAGQQVIEDRVIEYVEELLHLSGLDALVYAGGVALNCSINSRLAERCHRRRVDFVVPPPASDTGVAIGAAAAVHQEHQAVAPLRDPCLGRDFDPDTICRELREHGIELLPASPSEVACLLADSALCAWFQGRAETGPRALGRRSIVARPDSERVRDRLNLLKGRESWRPLAPSITAREFARSFQGVPSAHMLIASQVSSQAATRLAGVRHVDGSSRPQVVREGEDAYTKLIVAMGTATGGTEALTCTSLNSAGLPLAYSPGDALLAARAMGLDLLVGDGWLARLR